MCLYVHMPESVYVCVCACKYQPMKILQIKYWNFMVQLYACAFDNSKQLSHSEIDATSNIKNLMEMTIRSKILNKIV